MSEDEAIKELDSFLEGTDEEIAHSRADDVLCAYLRANGGSAVAEAYETCRTRVGFWYA